MDIAGRVVEEELRRRSTGSWSTASWRSEQVK
jgi:hypothetical protein